MTLIYQGESLVTWVNTIRQSNPILFNQYIFTIYLIANCRFPSDATCQTLTAYFNQALIELSEKKLSPYKLRYIDCLTNSTTNVCTRLHFNATTLPPIRFAYQSFQVYPYTSPLTELGSISSYLDVFKFKLTEMLRVADVRVLQGNWESMRGHEIIRVERRSIVVLESNDTKVVKLFQKVAKMFKEKYSSFRVTERDEGERVNDNYDNCYVLGPDGAIYTTIQQIGHQISMIKGVYKYLIPKHESIIDFVTEQEIKNIFQISSLPRAIVLRDHIVSQFENQFSNHLVFVALIDSSAPNYPVEFSYLIRDWIKTTANSSLRGMKISFAVLDWGYIDGQNHKIFEKYGVKQNRIPSIMALEGPKSGKYYRQGRKFDGGNFKEMSEGFMKEIENGENQIWSAKWRYQYLNWVNKGYWWESTIGKMIFKEEL